MRIYQTLKEAYGEVQRDLVEMGIEVHPESMQDKVVKDDDNFVTKELQGYCYSIISHKSIREDFESLGGNEPYAFQELIDRTSDDWRNPGTAWKHRPEVWQEFIHNGRMSYTYNERMREQIGMIRDELKRNPNTRQAIITMYDRHQDIANLGGKARIPCSLTYQFLIRRQGEGALKLDCIYTMRSCDVYTHFIYDVYITMKLQEYLAHSLGYESGRFIHFIGSLHAYKKDYSTKGVF